jgi:hypothetical protein
VNSPFRIAWTNRRKDLEVGIIQEIRTFLKEDDLPRCLDPPHLVHHLGTVYHLDAREKTLNFLPVCSAHEVLLETHPLSVEFSVLDHLAKATVWRFIIGVINFHVLLALPSLARAI